MTIREALLSLGYSERSTGRWLKPIGFQLFTYKEDRNEWTNWFKDATGVLSVWETKSFQHDQKQFGSYLHQLKHWETFTRTDMYVNGDSRFEMSIPDL